MGIGRGIRRAELARELDGKQWAGHDQVQFQTEVRSPTVRFGVDFRFEGQTLKSYTVVRPVQTGNSPTEIKLVEQESTVSGPYWFGRAFDAPPFFTYSASNKFETVQLIPFMAGVAEWHRDERGMYIGVTLWVSLIDTFIGEVIKGGEMSVSVAAVNATTKSKDKADFVCVVGVDDRITLENAADSIGWNGLVVLSEGAFTFDSGMVRASSGTLTFEGRGEDLTTITSTTVMANLFHGAAAINWTWKDLTLDGNDVVVSSVNWNAVAHGEHNMYRVTVRDFTGDGVSIYRSAGTGRFIDCRFTSNTGRGFYFRESDCNFFYCVFDGNGGDGLRTDQTNNDFIIGCLFENNGGAGWQVGNALTGGTVSMNIYSNRFINNNFGIGIAHGNGSHIQGNYFSGNGTSMAFGAGGFGVSENNFINGNLSKDTTFISGSDALDQIIGVNVHNGSVLGGSDLAGADTDAIHDNIAAEISAITEKTSPIAADLALIEDSAAGYDKKRVQLSNLPAPDHDILSTAHTDADETDTPSDAQVLTWDDPTMTVPTVRGVGTQSSDTPGLPSGTAVGDLLICVVESQPGGTVVATGWSDAPETGIQNGDNNTRLTLLYRIATGTGDAPTLTGWHPDHVVSQIIGITTGTYDSADPFGVSTQSAHSGSDSSTTLTFPGLTTLYKNSLILGFCAAHENGTASGFVNASLTSLTEQIDASTTMGNNGGIIGFSGTMADIGATGNTTATYSTAVRQARATFAISPLNPVVPAWRAVVAPAGGTALTTKGDLHGYDTGQARIPAGADDQVLTADAGEALGLKWAAAAGGSPLTTKGDLFGRSTVDARIPVGPDDQVLTADAAQALGVKWAEPAAGGGAGGGVLPAWEDWTPVWTTTGSAPSVGNGSLTGRFQHVGKTVHFRLQLNWGSTTSGGTGTYQFTLPVPASSLQWTFAANCLEGGVDNDVSIGLLESGSVFVVVIDDGNVANSTAPFTWGDTDRLVVTGTYEVDTDGGGGGAIVPTNTVTVELTASEAINDAGEYVPWDQVDADSDAPAVAWNSADPERLVAWEDGWYYVTATLEWQTTVTGDRWVRLSPSTGGSVGQQRFNIAGSNYQPTIGTSSPVYLLVGEYVRVFAGQDDGTPRNLLTGYTRATMTLIGGGGSGLVKGDFLPGDLYLGGEIHENQSATGRTDLYAAGGDPGLITRVKTADEGETTTTMQDDDELTFPIGANETWIMDAYLIVDGPTGGDIKVGVKGPSGVAGIFAVTGPGTTASSFENATVNNQTEAVGTAPTGLPSGTFGVGNKTLVEVHAVIRNGATAGDVVIQWAQNTSSGTTQVLTDSYLKTVRH